MNSGRATPRPRALSAELLSLYERIGIRDFDDPAHFAVFDVLVRNQASRNFVIDFSDDDSHCGFNLEACDFEELLGARVRGHERKRKFPESLYAMVVVI